MTETLLSTQIRTAYGSFKLLWYADDELGGKGGWLPCFKGQVNGLLGVSDQKGVFVVLADAVDATHLAIVLHSEQPSVDLDWEDVVEASVTVPPGSSPTWKAWGNMATGGLNLSPGSYRIRFSSKGRDYAGADQAEWIVQVTYRLDLWPSPPRRDSVIKITSADGAYWQKAVFKPRRMTQAGDPCR